MVEESPTESDNVTYVQEIPLPKDGALGEGIRVDKGNIVDPKDVEDTTPTEPDSSDH